MLKLVINLFHKYLLSTYYVPGTVLGDRDISNYPCSCGAYNLVSKDKWVK